MTAIMGFGATMSLDGETFGTIRRLQFQPGELRFEGIQRVFLPNIFEFRFTGTWDTATWPIALATVRRLKRLFAMMNRRARKRWRRYQHQKRNQ